MFIKYPNINYKIRCILNSNVLISEKLKPIFIKYSNTINKFRRNLSMDFLIAEN